jgi:hypothetical protein
MTSDEGGNPKETGARRSGTVPVERIEGKR